MPNSRSNFQILQSYPSLLPTLLTFLIHLPTINNGIVWDDRAALTLNPDSMATRPFMELFRNDFWGQDITHDDSHKSYRPVAIMSLRLNYLTTGLNPVPIHLCNIIIHTVITYLFTLLTSHVVNTHSTYTKPSTKMYLILAINILFSIHPVHTEPVSCIVGRSDLLSGLFYLSTILIYIRSQLASSLKKAALLFLAVLTGFLSSMSKETGVTCFGILVSIEIIKALTVSKAKAKKSSLPLDLKSCAYNLFRHFKAPSVAVATLIMLAAPLLILKVHLALHRNASLYKWSILENDISLLSSKTHRIMTYGYVHFLYFFKLLYPKNLCYDYGWKCINSVVSILDYRNVITVTFYFFVGKLAYEGATKQNGVYLYSGALTVVPFLPASNLFFPVGTILGERLLYLPSMGFCLGLPVVLFDFGSYVIASLQLKKSSVKVLKLVIFVGIAVIATACIYKSVFRGLEWRDELTLFQSALTVCPSSLKVLNNLATVLINIDKKNAPEAKVHLDKAIGMHPNYPSALFNLGLVHYVMQEEELAVERFEASIAIINYQPKTRAYLAQCLLTIAYKLQKNNQWDLAQEYFGKTLYQSDASINQGCDLPLIFHVRCAVGHELKLPGAENLEYCDIAIRLNDERKANGGDPNEFILTENTHNAAALVLRNLNRFDEAAERYRLGLIANPDCFELLVNAGGLYGDLGYHDEAMQYYSRALQMSPDSPELITNIGWLLELKGHLQPARQHYIKALELLGDYPHPQIVNNLKNVEVRIEQQHNMPIDEVEGPAVGGDVSGQDEL
ncbi:hypothetical protein TrVE_jg13055 [Triparma verrucosa]|uniref:dolichyl-phosphate-mannose--protein mannosyltransferase n=1 Tax=Triparma verrucosa TaxID=1606542 RepID=A0A9W7CBK9_9STRA|nr:hypothetical protein TrVE_jg13055 [Triparma verrucosa]